MKICVIAPLGLHEDRAEAIHLRGVFGEIAKRSHSITYIGLGERPDQSPSLREYAIRLPKIRRVWWPMFAAISVFFGAILDLVYGFDFFYFRDIVTPFFAEVLLKPLLGKKVVIEVNGVFSEEIIQTGRPRIGFESVIRRFERHVLRNADLCVCVCEWLAEEVVAKGVDMNNVILMPNGVNPREFDVGNAGREIKKHAFGGRKIIVFVGSFTYQQNVSLVIRATKLVAERIRDVKLMLVGDGPTRKSMEELVRHEGMRENVVFTGRVPHQSIPGLLAASCVAIVPFTRSATVRQMIPLKMFEYWAMGKPVVATRTSIDGIPEACDGDNVLIVEEDARSMAEGILAVLEDETLANRLGRNGRKLVEERYSWEMIVSRTLPILEERLAVGT